MKIGFCVGILTRRREMVLFEGDEKEIQRA